MPPRIGSNGAVIKPAPSAHGQRSARLIASKVVDLTGDSSDETPGSKSGEEEEPGYAVDRGRGHQQSSACTPRKTAGTVQAGVGGPKSNNHQRVARPAQDFILEDSFIVTSLHHRPWSAGDDNSTIGVFRTEKEAKAAAETHFEGCSSNADGWESEWRRRPHGGMLQLCGFIEEGEVDSETYTASIKPYQQKRQVAVQPDVPVVPNIARRKDTRPRPRPIYIVKEEQRMNVGEDDPEGFYNELGDLKAVDLHGIYLKLDDANDTARGVYGDIVEDANGNKETITDILDGNMAKILVADPEEMMTYSICVEQDWLR